MSPEALYTTIIASLSIGFFALTILFWFFIEDRMKYWVSAFAAWSVAVTFLLEALLFGFPRLAFTPMQIIAIPIGSAIAFGLFFFVVTWYTNAKSQY